MIKGAHGAVTTIGAHVRVLMLKRPWTESQATLKQCLMLLTINGLGKGRTCALYLKSSTWRRDVSLISYTECA